MKRIAIFASGSGSNAENIIRYFGHNPKIIFTKIYCNKKGAGVLERAERLKVETTVFSKSEFHDGTILSDLEQNQTDLIILAGFLWLIPQEIIRAFAGRIINIHPSLLPKYGGKGMYGMHVHEAVIENKETESGITIHLVDEEYDRGEVLFQAKTAVEEKDTPEILAQKIHELEYRFFPEVIENFLKNKFRA
ncbi:MAG: phosphoribosylglycinamide formyltransferase [Bacteroidetes bacterium]|nr:phosphoribosylglycinamide formyltransferase [Bacteroidota bacterium]